MDLNVRHAGSRTFVLLLTSIVSSLAGEYLEKFGMARGTTLPSTLPACTWSENSTLVKLSVPNGCWISQAMFVRQM